MVGTGFPRAGHCRLTVLLAFTVTSSTSSSVAPRITGGAGGGGEEAEGPAQVPGGRGWPWKRGWHLVSGAGWDPHALLSNPSQSLMQLRNQGHRKGCDLLDVTQPGSF